MSGRVIFEYDEKRNIIFTEDHWDIRTREDVDQFFDEYRKFFENIGRKVYMVSNIDHLFVHAEIAEYYGEVARTTVGQYLLGFARWGKDDFARMSVRTSSMKSKLPSNIYNTREEAIEAIEQQKKTAG